MTKSTAAAEPAKRARGDNGEGLGTPLQFRNANGRKATSANHCAAVAADYLDRACYERTLDALLNASPDTALLIDIKGTILALNGVAKTRLSALANGSLPRNGNLIGECVYDIFPKELVRSRKARNREVIRTGKPLRYEDQRGERWFDTSIQPINAANGKVTALAVFTRDITDRKQGEQALAESRETARALINAPTDTALLIDTRGTIIALNKTATQRFRELAVQRYGEAPKELVGLCVFDLFHEDVAATRRARNEEAVRSGKAARFIDQRNGYWYDNTIYPMKDAAGSVVRLAIYSRDITDIKEAEEEIRAQAQELASFNVRLSQTASTLAESQRELLQLNRELQEERRIVEDLNRDLERRVQERTQELRRAYEELQTRTKELVHAKAEAATDALTGLSNHRAFHLRIAQDIPAAEAAEEPISLIMLDVDNFKRVNDHLGHLAGDRILRGLARAVRKVVAAENAYRYGGDEFAILLRGTTAPDAAVIAEELRAALESSLKQADTTVTVSLGVADLAGMTGPIEELIYRADMAMYWAKSIGKNRVGEWSGLQLQRPVAAAAV
jgi:diguanylate cyclase (GGDEF)-like protein/PAS domain S-box-containing protein